MLKFSSEMFFDGSITKGIELPLKINSDPVHQFLSYHWKSLEIWDCTKLFSLTLLLYQYLP
jgi:hypothetical protein